MFPVLKVDALIVLAGRGAHGKSEASQRSLDFSASGRGRFIFATVSRVWIPPSILSLSNY
jgi:hypothetical protein